MAQAIIISYYDHHHFGIIMEQILFAGQQMSQPEWSTQFILGRVEEFIEANWSQIMGA